MDLKLVFSSNTGARACRPVLSSIRRRPTGTNSGLSALAVGEGESRPKNVAAPSAPQRYPSHEFSISSEGCASAETLPCWRSRRRATMAWDCRATTRNASPTQRRNEARCAIRRDHGPARDQRTWTLSMRRLLKVELYSIDECLGADNRLRHREPFNNLLMVHALYGRRASADGRARDITISPPQPSVMSRKASLAPSRQQSIYSAISHLRRFLTDI